ncbi:N-acetylglucosamine kinase [Microbacterium sp. A82]|uniref:N-acetylglucosamine kinase n=1 Tax=Microbacterium sp. A82 TaxID=3450452 RepID=UPI003F3CD5C5
MQTIVAVDLGKSQCRVAVISAEGRTVRTGVGAPGLATSDGLEASFAAILPLLPKHGDISALGIGAAGAWTASDAAVALARKLAEVTGAPTSVTSDVVTAHAGARGGASGTLLLAGTGAAALGIDADGVRLVDGWGPELGDFGSGSWIGREGIRATLRFRDGLGADTALSDALRTLIEPAADVLVWLGEEAATARRLATVAPLVLDAAEAGDDVAAGIVREAIGLLTASAVAASADPEVVLHGGLTAHPWFRRELERALVSAGRTVAPAIGDAFDGAVLLTRRTDLPHERVVHRAE